MQLHAGSRLFRALGFTEFTLLSEQITHIVGLVEGNNAVKILTYPFHNLIQTISALLRFDSVIGGIQDTFLQGYFILGLYFAVAHNFIFAASCSCSPVTDCVNVKVVVLGYPNGLCAALHKVVQNDTGDLSTLTYTGAVTDEKAFSSAVRQFLLMGLPGIGHSHQLCIGKVVFDNICRQFWLVGCLRHGHRCHSSTFHQHRRVLFASLNRDIRCNKGCIYTIITDLLLLGQLL